MTKDDNPQAGAPRDTAQKAEARAANKKAEARASALRANLMKRKQQSKTRAASGADTSQKDATLKKED
ncbi:MAG: hypothetical protein Q8K65_04755 [Alphaproteobacteria bacterium]|nr:hypothetical protein [Alphaproteobacteria bacterium]